MNRPLKKAIAFITACAFTAAVGITKTIAETTHEMAHYAVNSILSNNYNAFVNLPNANLLISGAIGHPLTFSVENPWSRSDLAITEVIGGNSIMDMVTSEGAVVRVQNSIGFTKFARINSGETWKRWEWQNADNNAGYAIINSEHIVVMAGDNKLALLLNNGTLFNGGAFYDNIDFDSNGFWYLVTGRTVTAYSPEMVAVVSKTFGSTSDIRMQWLSSIKYGDHYQIFDEYYTIEGVPAPIGYTPVREDLNSLLPENEKINNTKITASYTSDTGQSVNVTLGTNWEMRGKGGGGHLQSVTFYNGDKTPIVTVDNFTGSMFTQDYLVVYGISGLGSIDLDTEALKATASGGFFSGQVIVRRDNTVVLERGEISTTMSEFGTYSEATRTNAYRLYCAETAAALSTTYSWFEFGTDSTNGTIYVVRDSSGNQGILNRRGFTLVEPGDYEGLAYLEVDLSIFKEYTDTSFAIVNTTNGRVISPGVYINYILPPPGNNSADYWVHPWIKLPRYRHGNGNYSVVTTNQSGSEYGLLFFRMQ
jgi:hypothetical protein